MFYSYGELRAFARRMKDGLYGRMPTLVMGDPGIGKTWAFSEVYGPFAPDAFRMDANKFPPDSGELIGGNVLLTGTFTAPNLFARVQLNQHRDALVADDLELDKPGMSGLVRSMLDSSAEPESEDLAVTWGKQTPVHGRFLGYDKRGRPRYELLKHDFRCRPVVVMTGNYLPQALEWDRSASRLFVARFEPTIDEQIAYLKTWLPSLNESIGGGAAVMDRVLAAAEDGEILGRIDFRPLRRAAALFGDGTPLWQRAADLAFQRRRDSGLPQDCRSILDYMQIKGQERPPKIDFTSADLKNSVGRRWDDFRVEAALEHLLARRLTVAVCFQPGRGRKRDGYTYRLTETARHSS
jgi:hypothetical protein